MKITAARWGLLATGLLLFFCVGMKAQSNGGATSWELVSPNQVPRHGTFFFMSSEFKGRPGPPMPAYFGSGNVVYSNSQNGVFVVDDRPTAQQTNSLVDSGWSLFRSTLESLHGTEDSEQTLDLMGAFGQNSESESEGAGGFGTNLFLVITGITNDTVSTNVLITAVNTQEYLYYQLLSRTNLLDPDWFIEQEFYGVGGDTQTSLTVPTQNRSSLFFWAGHADARVAIYQPIDAAEPYPGVGDPGQVGSVIIQRLFAPTTSDLLVHYRVDGTASNGVDYSYLSGAITIPAGMDQTNLYVYPLADDVGEGYETVILTLMIDTNYYLLYPDFTSATINISDLATFVEIGATTNAIEPDGPTGAPAQVGSFILVRNDFYNHYPTLQVHYEVTGTASNGVDYTLLTGTAIIPAGSTTTNIYVQPLGDSLIEGTETVKLTLLPDASYSVASDFAIITFIDTTTTVSIGASTNAIEPDGPPSEPAVPGAFLLTRTDTRGLYPASPVYYTISGTASNGVDYAFLSGTVTIPEGATSTNIFVQPLGDSLVEGTETVKLTLTPDDSYIISSSSNATITVADSTTTVSITLATDAREPNPSSGASGQNGNFLLVRNDSRGLYPVFTVSYSMSGQASNGVDYTLLSGTITFAAGATFTNVVVQPIADNVVEFDETATLTLSPSSAYFRGADPSATISIVDNLSTNDLRIVATNLNGSIGIDYHSPLNSLVVSFNKYSSGEPRNFVLINGGGAVATNWTGVHGLTDEVKLATAKTTANGFTNGQVFFSNNGQTNRVGWVSADGSVSNLSFAVLTNDTYIRGSLYVDQTGVFSNDLIAVTGNGPLQGGGVWRINSSGTATRIVNITNTHLEGVITLTNDVAKWGPWAGKIIIGAEDIHAILAVDSNGTVTTNFLGIDPEDFDLIVTNRNLYACDPNGSTVLKFSSTNFNNYVGDLLVTDAGEINFPAKFSIVHWDAATTNFIKRSVSYYQRDGAPGQLEHATFAPINIPAR